MSIIPASRLSRTELSTLGNNFGPAFNADRYATPEAAARAKRRRQLAAVNRSLAFVGERVGRLHRAQPTFAAIAR